MLALECAVDELAEALDMDPVELRILNDVQYDPEKGPGRPYSSRRLVEALTVGAERFGWKERRRPASAARATGWSAWASPRPSAATWCRNPAPAYGSSRTAP